MSLSGIQIITYLHYLQLLIHSRILITGNGPVIHIHSLSVAPNVTIVGSSAGTPVSGSTNTFDYPILSSVTLTCMVDPMPLISVTYLWNSTRCYTNADYRGGNPQCFPDGQTTQNVTDSDVNAEDAGTITCTVTINGRSYASQPFTLRVSGEQLLCIIIVYGIQCGCDLMLYYNFRYYNY